MNELTSLFRTDTYKKRVSVRYITDENQQLIAATVNATGSLDRRQSDEARRESDNSLVTRTNKISEAVKNVFVKMTNDPAEAPLFFDGLENLYRMYNIPADLKAKLLLPLLSPKARQVTNRLPLSELDDYDVVKGKILAEFKLTSREYLQRFRNATKNPEETFTMLRSRLSNLLLYYLRSRKADKMQIKWLIC